MPACDVCLRLIVLYRHSLPGETCEEMFSVVTMDRPRPADGASVRSEARRLGVEQDMHQRVLLALHRHAFALRQRMNSR